MHIRPKGGYKGGTRKERVKLKFPNIDKKGRTINGNLKLALVSVYHPCHDPQHEAFSEVLDSLLTKASEDGYSIVMGADINAQVGIRDKEEYRQVLGPHGIDRRNTRGKVLFGGRRSPL